MTNYVLPSIETALGRRISVDAAGSLAVHQVPEASGASLHLEFAPGVLGLGDCSNFEFTTVPVLVPLQPSQCLHLIDPVLWPRFSDIETSNVNKTTDRGPGGWEGTFDEIVWVDFGGIRRRYVNTLGADFTIGATGSKVHFWLVKSIEGGLEYEDGYLELKQVAGQLFLTSHKTLRYKAGSEWCQLPNAALTAILGVWLQAATATYVLEMAKAQT